MARVITFSRTFPAYHPKKGQPTYFVEKVLRSLYGEEPTEKHEEILVSQNPKIWDGGKGNILLTDFFFSLDWRIAHAPKHTTIRAGKRWKVGDWFSPRVWSGKPYTSKQIQFAPDIQIKKVWEFDIIKDQVVLDSRVYAPLHPMSSKFHEVAKNDGLTAIEMIQWFNIHPKKTEAGFSGQIICWNESIEY